MNNENQPMTDVSPPDPLDPQDERDLFAFGQTGQRVYLESVWLRHCDVAWRLAHRICGQHVDDALQEAAVSVVSYAGSWQDRGPGSARAWLLTIVANAARKKCGRGSNRDVLFEHDALESLPAYDPDGNSGDQIDMLARVHRVLASLPDKYSLRRERVKWDVPQMQRPTCVRVCSGCG